MIEVMSESIFGRSVVNVGERECRLRRDRGSDWGGGARVLSSLVASVRQWLSCCRRCSLTAGKVTVLERSSNGGAVGGVLDEGGVEAVGTGVAGWRRRFLEGRCAAGKERFFEG